MTARRPASPPAALLAVAALGLLGCPSFSTLGSARTLPKGEAQVFVAPQILGVDAWSVDGDAANLRAPQVEVGARLGVADGVELGLKAWLLGIAFDTKVQLSRGDRVAVALDPSIGYVGLQDGLASGDAITVTTLSVPLLVGYDLGHDRELVLAPRLAAQFARGGGGAANTLWAGGSAGVIFPAGGHIRVMPEISVCYPFHTWDRTSSSTFDFGGIVYQLSFGLLFGGFR